LPVSFLPNPAQISENESEAGIGGQNILPKQELGQYKTIKAMPISLLAAIWAAGMLLFLLYHLGAYFYTLQTTPLEYADSRRRNAAPIRVYKKGIVHPRQCAAMQIVKSGKPSAFGLCSPAIDPAGETAYARTA